MKRQVYVVKIGLCLLLASCWAGPTHLQAQAPQSPTPQATPTGQFLPIGAIALIAGQKIELEVTRTPEEQAMGLMYRTSLPANRGMLFEFDPPRPVRFWMKNCKMALDMIFLREGVVQAIEANVPPCTTDEQPCPTYGPDEKTKIDQVIELRSGRAAELGLKVGDPVSVQFLPASQLPAP